MDHSDYILKPNRAIHAAIYGMLFALLIIGSFLKKSKSEKVETASYYPASELASVNTATVIFETDTNQRHDMNTFASLKVFRKESDESTVDSN